MFVNADRSCIELNLICIDDRLTVSIESVEMIFFEHMNETHGWLSMRTSSDPFNPRYVHLEVNNKQANQIQSDYRDYKRRTNNAKEVSEQVSIDKILAYERPSLSSEQLSSLSSDIKVQYNLMKQLEETKKKEILLPPWNPDQPIQTARVEAPSSSNRD